MPPIKDLVGQRFGRLIVLKFDHCSSARAAYWLCQCDCGGQKIIRGGNLTVGKATSCGCYRKEIQRSNKNRLIHGLTGTKFFKLWCHMRQRCLDPNCKDYKHYGGRGIKICDEWLDPVVFVAWCESQNPQGNLSLDRYPDQNGNYEPSNCRFATSQEQNRNRRDNVLVEYEGQTYCRDEFVKKFAVVSDMTYRRRILAGMAVAEAAFTPLTVTNLVGERFGKLVVISATTEKRRRCSVWECQCDCGKMVKVITTSLRSGNTKSCGCLSRDHLKRVHQEARLYREYK